MKSHFKKHRKVTPKIKLQIIKRYTSGEPVIKIAKRYDIATSTVSYHLKKAGKWKKRTIKYKLELKRKKIIKAYQAGMKIPKIVRKFHTIDVAVVNLLVEKGIYDFTEKTTKNMSKEDKRKLELLKLQSEKINKGKSYEDYL